jgi:hypothetical protein
MVMDATQKDSLVGRWQRDPLDSESSRHYGEITLQFTSDGQLIYTEYLKGKRQISMLTYRVEGPFIVTDQPSAPREERTAFEFTDEGKLVLVFGGVKSVYVRA